MDTKGNLFFALMYKDNNILEKTINELKNSFGNIIKKSEAYDFNFTDYYEKEFGKDLKKTMIIFDNKINKKDLIDIKKFISKIEKEYSINKKRKINIDPGIIDNDGVFLASFKKRDFKEDLGDGVYLHKVLEFVDGIIKDFWHTFEDFKEEKIKRFLFNYRV